MTTIYNNQVQTINQFIPQLNKSLPVSIQTLDKEKNIIYRSFKVYSFPYTIAKDIKLIDLGYYSEAYKSSSYYEITQEFIVDTYSSTQELINGQLVPSFRVWEHTTTHLNHKRQLGNSEKLKVIWTPPTLTAEQELQLTPQQLQSYLQPITIQVGDVYGVTIPSNCIVLEPTNLDANLLKNIDTIKVKPTALVELVFSFRGIDVISLELPTKIITDNPNLTYSRSITNPPKVPPNIQVNTNFPDPTETPLLNYSQRRNRPTGLI